MAQFTDLPMEILIMIAKILYGRYMSTGNGGTKTGRHIIGIQKDVDASIFAARRVNSAMKTAIRTVMFSQSMESWGCWDVTVMERRIGIEEKKAEGLL